MLDWLHSRATNPDSPTECSSTYHCERSTLAKNNYITRKFRSPCTQLSQIIFAHSSTLNLSHVWPRHRAFGSVARRDVTDQLLFEVVFRRGFSAVEAREELSRRCVELSVAAVEERIQDLRRCLSSRQLWLLSSGNTMLDSIDGEEGGTYVVEPLDPTPDPEALAVLRETHQDVSAALASLTDSDRLLVRLRYQEGLTLQQVARLVGLKDAQTADRRLRDIIDHLRRALGIQHLVRGKPKPASV